MITKKFFILIILSSFSVLNIYAQRLLKFNKLTVENGLSQSNINHIIQDHKGFLWFATNGGLNRFDGIGFRTYVFDLLDTNSISNNIINHLYEDEEGNIWISTQNGLDFYHESSERLTHFKNELNNPNSLSNNHIVCTIKDNDGNLWIGTAGGGLNKYHPETNVFKTYITNIQNNQSISSNYITCIEKDKYGFLWIGTADNGLNMFDPVTEKFLRYEKTQSPKTDGLSSNQIRCIYEDNDGDLWIGTSAGINLVKPAITGRNSTQLEEIIDFSTIITGKNSVIGSSITSIYQGESGLIWFGTTDLGLGYINKYLNVSGSYVVDPNNDYSLLSNNVTSVFDDKSGILWIGTNAGINSINKLRNRFEWHRRIPGMGNTLSSNNVHSILKEDNGIIWIGTYDQGLTKYDPLTDIYTNYLIDDYFVEGESIKERNYLMKKFDQRKTSGRLEKISYLNHNRISKLHKDTKNNIWIGTGGGGINILNPKSGAISSMRHKPGNENSLSSDHIRSLFQDSSGKMWIGTEDRGLNVYENNLFRRYTTDPNDLFSISHNNISAIAEDKNGVIWVGTFGGGINKYDLANNRFIRYFYKTGLANSLSSNNIYTLYYDKPSKLWIGTTDGLDILNIDNNEIHHISVNDGLPSNSIYSILEDDQGNIWVSTNKGLSRITKTTLAIKNYGKEDGLQSTEFNPRSGFITSNGEMFFGSINGYCSFFPDAITDNTTIPEVMLTDFKIFNESVKINTPGSPLKKNISKTDTITLSHKDISISFEYVALNFTDSKKNQYAYMLENFDEKWNYVGTRRYANYTNLEPGHYVFRMKASNNDGVWNETGKSVFIIVKPPFWRTWWFYSIIIIFIFGSIVLTIQLRTRSLIRSKILLEEQVKRRTKQIKNQNETLKSANHEILVQKAEIETQNKLLLQKNAEISKAKQDLDAINKQLVDTNANLEDKVEERTYSLKQINEELINANNELDKFIYRASHDLKGPIARLLGVSILAKMDNKDETLREYIDLIEKGAFDINKVLNKLNNIHFINKEILQTDIIDFEKIINACKPNLSIYIDLADLEINLVTETKFHLRSDYNLMRIIVENLLENAVIFRKTKKAIVTVNLNTDQKSIILSVHDHGLGILNEQHDKIFEMFYRGSQKSKGNGLGLYLVKKSVQKLQGRIEVESEEGKYSQFTIFLPKVIVPKELQSLVS
jgi:ligand-binding sensor domain-containing protein/signal transduction histidine kinase